MLRTCFPRHGDILSFAVPEATGSQDGCGWQYQMANALNLISSVRTIPRQSLTCFQYQSTEKFRDLSQHTATSILFIGNIAYVNATPSHKWFDSEFTY